MDAVTRSSCIPGPSREPRNEKVLRGVNEWIDVSDIRGLHAFGEFVQFCVVKTLNIKT